MQKHEMELLCDIIIHSIVLLLLELFRQIVPSIFFFLKKRISNHLINFKKILFCWALSKQNGNEKHIFPAIKAKHASDRTTNLGIQFMALKTSKAIEWINLINYRIITYQFNHFGFLDGSYFFLSFSSWKIETFSYNKLS